MQEKPQAENQSWLGDGLLHAIYESAKSNPFETLLALLVVVCFFRLLAYRLKRVAMDHDLQKHESNNYLSIQVEKHKHAIDRIKARQQDPKD